MIADTFNEKPIERKLFKVDVVDLDLSQDNTFDRVLEIFKNYMNILDRTLTK